MYKLELEKEHRLGRDKDKVIQTEHERNEELRRRISELQDQVNTNIRTNTRTKIDVTGWIVVKNELFDW